MRKSVCLVALVFHLVPFLWPISRAEPEKPKPPFYADKANLLVYLDARRFDWTVDGMSAPWQWSPHEFVEQFQFFQFQFVFIKFEQQ